MNDEPRWHEMTYAEIGSLFRELTDNLTWWRELCISYWGECQCNEQWGSDCLNCKALREALEINGNR